jgi:phosphomevalonate kinase
MTGVRNGMEVADTSLQMSVRESYRSITHREDLPVAGITVDTGVFFDRRGRKLGFGSSAAAALLFACGLTDAENAGKPGIRGEAAGEGHPERDLIVRISLDAHRHWQGGRGSGYDILSSAAGGAGLFTGGPDPTRTSIPWPVSLNAWIIRGAEAVSSPGAVRIYQRWKGQQGRTGEPIPILKDMNDRIWTLVSLLTSGVEVTNLLEPIHELACLGADLGRELGIPALPDLPGVFSSADKPWYRPGRSVTKCLGAGDETVLLLSVPDGLSHKERQTVKRLEEEGRAAPLSFEKEGLRLERDE